MQKVGSQQLFLSIYVVFFHPILSLPVSKKITFLKPMFDIPFLSFSFGNKHMKRFLGLVVVFYIS